MNLPSIPPDMIDLFAEKGGPMPFDENVACIQFAVNDPAGGFITRHCGTAVYTDGRFHLKTKTI